MTMKPENRATLERLDATALKRAEQLRPLNLDGLDALMSAVRAEEQARAKGLVEALELAYEMIVHGDFKNGVTDSTGTIDEGDVRAGEMMDILKCALASYRKTGGAE